MNLISPEGKQIVSILNNLSGSRSQYEVFCDWVKCTAIAIQNSCTFYHGEAWKRREKEYIETMSRYKSEQSKFAEMTALLTISLEKEMEDILGEIYMAAGLGNKSTGQFFTPFHLSYLCARMNLKDEDGTRPIYLNEPSCGGGGMIIAAAKVLKERGINYQTCLEVVAQDLDWKAVYMTYVQLSLLGIKATVAQGNTLKEPYIKHYPEERVFNTPRKLRCII